MRKIAALVSWLLLVLSPASAVADSFCDSKCGNVHQLLKALRSAGLADSTNDLEVGQELCRQSESEVCGSGSSQLQVAACKARQDYQSVCELQATHGQLIPRCYAYDVTKDDSDQNTWQYILGGLDTAAAAACWVPCFSAIPVSATVCDVSSSIASATEMTYTLVQIAQGNQSLSSSIMGLGQAGFNIGTDIIGIAGGHAPMRTRPVRDEIRVPGGSGSLREQLDAAKEKVNIAAKKFHKNEVLKGEVPDNNPLARDVRQVGSDHIWSRDVEPAVLEYDKIYTEAIKNGEISASDEKYAKPNDVTKRIGNSDADPFTEDLDVDSLPEEGVEPTSALGTQKPETEATKVEEKLAETKPEPKPETDPELDGKTQALYCMKALSLSTMAWGRFAAIGENKSTSGQNCQAIKDYLSGEGTSFETGGGNYSPWNPGAGGRGGANNTGNSAIQNGGGSGKTRLQEFDECLAQNRGDTLPCMQKFSSGAATAANSKDYQLLGRNRALPPGASLQGIKNAVDRQGLGATMRALLPPQMGAAGAALQNYLNVLDRNPELAHQILGGKSSFNPVGRSSGQYSLGVGAGRGGSPSGKSAALGLNFGGLGSGGHAGAGASNGTAIQFGRNPANLGSDIWHTDSPLSIFEIVTEKYQRVHDRVDREVRSPSGQAPYRRRVTGE